MPIHTMEYPTMVYKEISLTFTEKALRSLLFVAETAFIGYYSIVFFYYFSMPVKIFVIALIVPIFKCLYDINYIVMSKILLYKY